MISGPYVNTRMKLFEEIAIAICTELKIMVYHRPFSDPL